MAFQRLETSPILLALRSLAFWLWSIPLGLRSIPFARRPIPFGLRSIPFALSLSKCPGANNAASFDALHPNGNLECAGGSRQEGSFATSRSG